ncbi:MAG: ABC transporter substrate-binding protein [Actinomycetota bacterium]
MLGALLTMITAACGVDAGTDDESEPIAIFGPYRGGEADRWIEVIHNYTEPRGIDVRYIGSEDFVADLQQRSGEGNDPPDIAVIPQPGFVDELAAGGVITPLGDDTVAGIEANYPNAIVDLIGDEVELFGVPFRLAMKSLVWYRPDVFEANGWTTPNTMDELADLVDTIDDTAGITPWCIGLEAGTSTGWPATDWVEDLVVRNVGTIVYNRWARGEVSFADPRIEASFGQFRELALEGTRAVGGLTGVVETAIDDAVDPLFDDEDGCALYKQADFAVQWMPDGTTIGADGDVDWFVMPPVVDGTVAPVVVGADQVVQFTTSDDIEGLMAYLAGPDAGASWAAAGGFISPKSTITADDYADATDAELTVLIQQEPPLVFDASDQMPVDVGSDLLWAQITDWVADGVTYEQFATTVDDALDDAFARELETERDGS